MLDRRGDKTYCYRSQRAGTKVRRVYLGAGQAALDAHQELAERQRIGHAQKQEAELEEQRYSEALAPLADFSGLLGLATKATLMRLGFHQHARFWRLKRHGRETPD